MCKFGEDFNPTKKGKRAAETLARIIEAHFGIPHHIAGFEARAFIINYWDRLTVLAHTIHEDKGE